MQPLVASILKHHFLRSNVEIFTLISSDAIFVITFEQFILPGVELHVYIITSSNIVDEVVVFFYFGHELEELLSKGVPFSCHFLLNFVVDDVLNCC